MHSGSLALCIDTYMECKYNTHHWPHNEGEDLYEEIWWPIACTPHGSDHEWHGQARCHSTVVLQSTPRLLWRILHAVKYIRMIKILYLNNYISLKVCKNPFSRRCESTCVINSFICELLMVIHSHIMLSLSCNLILQLKELRGEKYLFFHFLDR